MYCIAFQVSAITPAPTNWNRSYPSCSRVTAALCGVGVDKWVEGIKHRVLTGKPIACDVRDCNQHEDKSNEQSLIECELCHRHKEKDCDGRAFEDKDAMEESGQDLDEAEMQSCLPDTDAHNCCSCRVNVSASMEDVDGLGEVTATVVAYLADCSPNTSRSPTQASVSGYPLQLWR